MVLLVKECIVIDLVTGEVIGPFIRTAYNYDMNAASDAAALHCLDESRAQQQFRDECDINTIVRQFGLTGEVPSDVKVPLEGDFADVVDFQSAMNVVRRAEESFMEMPAEVRAEFGNDPGRFVAFVNDPDNRVRAEKLGVVVPRETPKAVEPVLVKVVPEVSGGGASST